MRLTLLGVIRGVERTNALFNFSPANYANPREEKLRVERSGPGLIRQSATCNPGETDNSILHMQHGNAQCGKAA